MHDDLTLPDGSVRIPLRARDGSVRAYAIVDAADAEFANQWRWCLNDGYAVCRTHSARLHRVLLGLTHGDGLEGDHINRDRLDNRRANLRVLTKAGNCQNKSSYTGAASPFRGVHWHKTSGKWLANVRANGKVHHLGLFATQEEAAEVAREGRRRLLPHAID